MERQEAQSEILRLASLIAHQLQSPISAASTILKALGGEVAGALSAEQKDLLGRANARCEEGIDTVRRMLAIVSAMSGPGEAGGVTDLAAAVRRAQMRYQHRALERGVTLNVEIRTEPAYVRGAEEALAEVIGVLMDNALKYTPEHGQVRLTVAAETAGGSVRLSVADSGVGIPKNLREKVFEPFFRAPAAHQAARPGVGLGLAFAKAVVTQVGGSISAGKADLGGAEIVVNLPAAQPADVQVEQARKSHAMRVVVVGGVAAGLKAASKIIRLKADADVTVVERDEYLSYAGCGLPYYIAGLIKDQADLMSTPAGIVRDAVFFQSVKNVHVFTRTEAMEIDRAGKRVRVRDLKKGEESWLGYDKLVLATGAAPVVPSIPGADLGNIFALHGVRDAEGIKAALSRERAHDVVIVGGGLIGMETTEALAAAGCRMTIVEMLPQTLRILDADMARLVELHLESKGVKVMTGVKVLSFEGEGKVQTVVTDRGSLPADLVIMGIGVRPNVSLAKAAGLEIGTTGAIKVDDRMRTSDPDIYAAGDCVECRDLLTGRACYVPLGSTANKQGRVAAVNICGGHDTFPGIVGSVVLKVFDYCVGRTGLTEAAARAGGYDVVSALAPAPDRAHYMPTAGLLMLKIVVDRPSRRLLGVQAIGPGAGDKRIDVAAMAIASGWTVDQLANADLCYAPPFSPALDNLITAANVAKNKLDGSMVGVSAAEVHRMLQDKHDFLFVDVRTPGEYSRMRLPGSTLIPLGTLRGRLSELPKNKEIVTFCQISLRGYEAARILQGAGFSNVRVLDGGVVMWPYEKVR
ncbi:MAG: FAD-dependent oxidoreductase [Phycisphaerae bacterium]|jgi:NADPH-dependent 2,4-dienoyl-CoA reductase/sulfur reductase-like enzyme/rhodanese-related sulfurtransferase